MGTAATTPTSLGTRLRASDIELGMVLVCGSLLLGALSNRRQRRLGHHVPRVPVVSIRLAPWLVSLALAVSWITIGSQTP